MKKQVLSISLVALLLLTGVMVAAGTTATATPPVKTLAKPQLISPKNNAVIDNGATFTLLWKPVPGAVSYTLTLQRQQADGTWARVFEETGIAHSDSTLSITIEDLSLNHFRWNVVAAAADPLQNSAPSSWHTFTIVATDGA